MLLSLLENKYVFLYSIVVILASKFAL